MSVLAQASATELEAAWDGLPARPAYTFVRRPETGLVMVRARAGGTGMQFNLGEMTVTRCSVLIPDGAVGHAYVAGRRPDHAERAAVFDALLQDPERRGEIERMVIGPLAERRERRHQAVMARAAATRVEFFTMVRGEE
jgi:alpha-D-ribose 1-methylphosphonate 5-triphosphate synthase subunit PhnG